ncbi:Major facilitator superfamily domain, general substrate transporter [Pseudocohnilembus persalinus]|uniref:Major facilitator superfamily domain, general substrate transporter n=1 Tax=Pseudocohnilembus persalinus TaxID=266149 RepID=A0A0V0QKS5_PSEPJ|nr:Major facilitator superfamily domain, general substrate transporter [Pseudocohnilembus persalinus]|eukprot:KRX02829.1 Major facilitator superfamily domain, general substrate transporter [Pseudocohnilembus persalinus]
MESLSIPKKELLRFLFLTLGSGLFSITFSVIPFIFYRPSFECYELQLNENQEYFYSKFQCSEFQACNILQYDEMYDPKYDKNYSQSHLQSAQISEKSPQYKVELVFPYFSIDSISSEYQLYCDDKIQEANLISLTVFCQAMGGLFAQGLILLYSKFCISIFGVTLILGIWNFAYIYTISVIYSHINSSFPKKLQDFGPTCVNLFWCLFSLSYIGLTLFWGNWRDNLSIIVFGVGLIFTKKDENEQKNSNSQDQEQQYNLDQNNQYEENEQQNFVQELIQNSTILKDNKPLLYNAIFWIYSLTTASVCFFLVQLIINTLVGDLYVNSFGSALLELIGNTLSGILIYKKIDLRKSLSIVYLTMSIAYIFSIFMVDNNTEPESMTHFQVFITLIPVIVGKFTHELLWTLLYTYLNEIVPPKYQQFVVANGQLFSNLILCLLPYYKYLMEYLGLNNFILIALMCLSNGVVIKKFQQLKEEDLIHNSKNKNIEIPLLEISFNS